MFTSLGLPFIAIENPELQRAFLYLSKQLYFPLPSTMKNWLIDDLAIVKEAIHQEIPADNTKVSIALDCWTAPSNANKVGFLAMLTYWIDLK